MYACLVQTRIVNSISDACRCSLVRQRSEPDTIDERSYGLTIRFIIQSCSRKTKIFEKTRSLLLFLLHKVNRTIFAKFIQLVKLARRKVHLPFLLAISCVNSGFECTCSATRKTWLSARTRTFRGSSIALCARQQFCFHSHSSPRVITRRDTQQNEPPRARTHCVLLAIYRTLRPYAPGRLHDFHVARMHKQTKFFYETPVRAVNSLC